MSQARVTKIICPSCKGSGKFSPVFDFACTWCKGATRVSVEDGRRYADNVYMLAGGGYIAGDHSHEDMLEMQNRAEQIYALTQMDPPWLRPEGQAHPTKAETVGQ
jgi:hypothetical protein